MLISKGVEREWATLQRMMNRSILVDKRKYSSFHHPPGQGMVEFALILPLFVLIIAGIFDLGRAFYASISITNAAREGARFGTLNPGDSQGICDASLTESEGSGIKVTYSNVMISCNNSVTCLSASTPVAGCNRLNPLKVIINYKYDEMVLGFFFPSGIDMQRSVEMQVP
jgi:Flp pilus assembly protein TadG